MFRVCLALLFVAAVGWPTNAQEPTLGEQIEQRFVDTETATATNANDIDALEASVATVQAEITALQDAITALQNAVDLNTVAIAGNATNITTNADAISANETADAARQAAIDALEVALAAAQAELATLTTTVNGLSDTVGGLITITDDHETRITALEQGQPADQPIGPVSDVDAAPNEVQENLVGATVGVTLSATDPDAGDTVTCGLSDDAGGLFQADPVTCIVTTAQATDFETATSHTIVGTAVSSGDPATVVSVPIDIAVLNDPSDDPPPPPITIVDTDLATADEVTTAAETNDYAGITLAAQNLPAGVTVTDWDISNWAGGRFRLNTAALEVQARRTSGDEGTFVPGTYTITITIELSEGDPVSQNFTMTIVEEQAALSIQDDDNQPNEILEGAAQGTPIFFLARLSDGTNPGGWSLADDAGGVVQIDTASGELSAGPTPTDFETLTSHAFTVENAALALTRVFMVNVLNDPADDPPPPVSQRGPGNFAGLPMPTRPTSFDVELTNCGTLVSAFNARSAGETIIINVGECRIANQVADSVTSAFTLRDNQTVFIQNSSILGSVLVPDSAWSQSGGDWFAGFDEPTGDNSCGCSNEQNFTDDDNPLADDRLAVIFNNRILIQVSGNPGFGEWARSGNEIRLGQNPIGQTVAYTHVNSFYRGSATGVTLSSDGTGEIAEFATRMHRGTFELSTGQSIVNGVTFRSNTSNALRVCATMVANSEFAGNGQAGIQQRSNGDTCQFAAEAEFTGPDGQQWFYALVNNHCYGNNALKFADNWAASSCMKAGLGLDFASAVRNITDYGPNNDWPGDGKPYWWDNNNTGPALVWDNTCFGEACATSEHLIISGDPYDGFPKNGYDSAYLVQDNLFIADGNGGFECNRAHLSTRRQPWAHFINNIVVTTGRTSGYCIKQTDTDFTSTVIPSSSGGIIGSTSFENAIRDNVFAHLPGSEGGVNGVKYGAGWCSGSGVSSACDFADFDLDLDANRYIFPTGHSTDVFFWTAPGGNERTEPWDTFRSATGFESNGVLEFDADVEARVIELAPEAAPYLDLVD